MNKLIPTQTLRQDNIELNVKKQIEVEYMLEGNISPRIGHKIFEVNKETGMIEEAKYKQNTTVYLGEKPTFKLILQPNCVYIPALNAENAKKKYLKDKNQSSYYAKAAPMRLSDIPY